jgi:hypothetical protein
MRSAMREEGPAPPAQNHAMILIAHIGTRCVRRKSRGCACDLALERGAIYNTMVFTHLPSIILLMLIQFASNLSPVPPVCSISSRFDVATHIALDWSAPPI